MAAFRKDIIRAPTVVPIQLAASLAPIFHPTKKPATVKIIAITASTNQTYSELTVNPKSTTKPNIE